MRDFGTGSALVAGASACIILMAGPAAALDLNLRCDGIGTFPESHSVHAMAYSNGHFANGTASMVERGSVPDRFLVVVTGDTVRVRPPTSIIPPLHGGAKDGWWDLTGATISDTEIGGRFSINFLNKPTVKIDRTNGSIEVQGNFDLSFRGTCEAVNPDARKF